MLAKDVCKHLVGRILLPLAISAPVGHVIGIAGQDNEIIPLHRRALDDLFKQGPDRAGILQAGVPQGHEQVVLLPLRHLAGVKFDLQQVLLGRPGQRLAQHRQNLSDSSCRESVSDWSNSEMISRFSLT